MEKEQRGSRGSGRRGRAGSCGQRGNHGLCDGELGKRLLTANFRARFRRRNSEKAALWLEIPQRCLKVSMHEVMNDGVPVLVGLSPEREIWGGGIDKIQVSRWFPSLYTAAGWKQSHRDKPLVPET